MVVFGCRLEVKGKCLFKMTCVGPSRMLCVFVDVAWSIAEGLRPEVGIAPDGEA